MKAYLFIETGEVREPKGGEYFIDRIGTIVGCPVNGYPVSPILTRHEIEIPSGATEVRIGWDGPFWYQAKTIPIPRPKKVKKWKYAFVVANEIVCQTQHLSEDEVARMTCYGPKRIDETMVEVEE